MIKYLLQIAVVVLVLWLVAFFISYAKAEGAMGPATMNNQIDQTNFVVNSGCSGTLIDLKKRYILTAAHCVDDQYETVEREDIDDKGEVKKKKIRVLKPGTVKQLFFQSTTQVQTVTYRTKLEKVDKDVDLALLQIMSTDFPNKWEARLACKEPKRLDKVYVVGNPMGRLYSSVTTGIVSSMQRDYASIPFDNDKPEEGLMQVSAGVIGGNSGGSVYNEEGDLIGVPVLANRTNEVIGFAVPLDVIKNFLEGKIEDKCTAKP